MENIILAIDEEDVTMHDMQEVILCEVPLENTKQIPSYPKIQGYA